MLIRCSVVRVRETERERERERESERERERKRNIAASRMISTIAPIKLSGSSIIVLFDEKREDHPML